MRSTVKRNITVKHNSIDVTGTGEADLQQVRPLALIIVMDDRGLQHRPVAAAAVFCNCCGGCILQELQVIKLNLQLLRMSLYACLQDRCHIPHRALSSCLWQIDRTSSPCNGLASATRSGGQAEAAAGASWALN